jgi:DNA-binding NarL/FixJ family response regulator
LSDEKFNDEGKPTMCKHKYDFSNAEYQKYLSNCPFTDEEIKIFEMKRKGKSEVEISLALNLSERTVARRMDCISYKIQKES